MRRVEVKYASDGTPYIKITNVDLELLGIRHKIGLSHLPGLLCVFKSDRMAVLTSQCGGARSSHASTLPYFYCLSWL